jgi:hypothetical protein
MPRQPAFREAKKSSSGQTWIKADGRILEGERERIFPEPEYKEMENPWQLSINPED